MTPKEGSTLESSSTIIDSEISSTGDPPYSSGIVTPWRPYSRKDSHSSEGGVCVLSLCSTVGASTVSAKSRTISRIICCSSFSAKFMFLPIHPKRPCFLTRLYKIEIMIFPNYSNTMPLRRV